MRKFKKATKAEQEITTSSLPDIVFLLLFFFMVSATIRVDEQQVKTQIPQAKYLSKTDKKILIKELQIGVPTRSEYGKEPKIYSDNKFIGLNNIEQWVSEQRATIPEIYKNKMIVLIKADENVEMGIIIDIKEKLRAANARKVVFRTLEKNNTKS